MAFGMDPLAQAGPIAVLIRTAVMPAVGQQETGKETLPGGAVDSMKRIVAVRAGFDKPKLRSQETVAYAP